MTNLNMRLQSGACLILTHSQFPLQNNQPVLCQFMGKDDSFATLIRPLDAQYVEKWPLSAQALESCEERIFIDVISHSILSEEQQK